MTKEAVTIVLVDDHKLVRQGVKGLLESHPDLRVVGEASNGAEAIAVVERLRPRVLITDLAMAGANGIEVTRRIRELVPETRIIVLSMHSYEGYVTKALASGASGYVLKGEGIDDLVEAVRIVATGGRYVSKTVSMKSPGSPGGNGSGEAAP